MPHYIVACSEGCKSLLTTQCLSRRQIARPVSINLHGVTDHGTWSPHSQSETSILVMWSLSANQRPVSRSCDPSQPIRGQYPGHVINLSQSEASILPMGPGHHTAHYSHCPSLPGPLPGWLMESPSHSDYLTLILILKKESLLWMLDHFAFQPLLRWPVETWDGVKMSEIIAEIMTGDQEISLLSLPANIPQIVSHKHHSAGLEILQRYRPLQYKTLLTNNLPRS